MSLEADRNRYQAAALASAKKDAAIAHNEIGRALNPEPHQPQVLMLQLGIMNAEAHLEGARLAGNLFVFLDDEFRKIEEEFRKAGVQIPADETPTREQLLRLISPEELAQRIALDKEHAEWETRDRKARKDKNLIRQHLGSPDDFVLINGVTDPKVAMEFKHEEGEITLSLSGEHHRFLGDNPELMFNALDGRVRSVLEQAGVTSSRFAEMSAAELLKTKGIGKVTIGKIVKALYDADFRAEASKKTKDPITPSASVPETLNDHFYDNFSGPARAALTMAQEEARRLNHNYTGTEHILLGLLRVHRGVAVEVLTSLGVEPSKVRSAVELIIGRGNQTMLRETSLTPRAKEVIKLSVEETRKSDHKYVGTVHLLLGLVSEGEGVAAGVLESLGVTEERVRTVIQEHYRTTKP